MLMEEVGLGGPIKSPVKETAKGWGVDWRVAQTKKMADASERKENEKKGGGFDVEGKNQPIWTVVDRV